MPKIILIAHNLRSTYNVGSILRTADGLGVDQVYLTGYTPYPVTKNDARLPHLAAKIDRQIHKTALDAEKYVNWEHQPDVFGVIEMLKTGGFRIAALEQSIDSTALPDFKPVTNIALIVGREVEGLEKEVLEKCDLTLEIPMFGKKESFNVTQATAMALFQVRFFKK